jgi:hypothetical protein
MLLVERGGEKDSAFHSVFFFFFFINLEPRVE